MPVEELPYKEEIIEKDDIKYFSTSTKHIGLLSYYLQDVPDIKAEIDNLKQPDHTNLIALAKSYHNVVCDGDKCIIYEKKLPAFKINPEIVVGVNNFYQSGYKSNLQFGLLGHIWSPRITENFYLKTGLFYLPVLNNGNWYGYLIKLPVHFEYIYPKGKIRPMASVGFNFYTNELNSNEENVPYSDFSTTAFSGGVEVQLQKSLYLTTIFDFDFYHNDNIYEIKLASLSASIGIKYQL
jgi:hypothetical protein